MRLQFFLEFRNVQAKSFLNSSSNAFKQILQSIQTLQSYFTWLCIYAVSDRPMKHSCLCSASAKPNLSVKLCILLHNESGRKKGTRPDIIMTSQTMLSCNTTLTAAVIINSVSSHNLDSSLCSVKDQHNAISNHTSKNNSLPLQCMHP